MQNLRTREKSEQDSLPGSQKPSEEVAKTPAGPEEKITISNQFFGAVFSTHGGGLSALYLKGYHATPEADSLSRI